MHWKIAYRTSPEEPFKMVPNPEFAWAADPFLIKYEEKIYLFAELFLYKSERNGVIGYCEFMGDHFSEWKVTMDEHWHLSYPTAFSLPASSIAFVAVEYPLRSFSSGS
ncbi:hypothetical protein IMSAG117_00914 [Lactobacillaceae bacterium]|nr:hypothetical protein IMSAG117_00914 [Lactobacillaceae bacterium]